MKFGDIVIFYYTDNTTNERIKSKGIIMARRDLDCYLIKNYINEMEYNHIIYEKDIQFFSGVNIFDLAELNL